MIKPRPLDPTTDRAALVGRDSLFQEVYDGVLAGTCFVLYGGERLGKTSILRSLKAEISRSRDPRPRCAYISLLTVPRRADAADASEWQAEFWNHLRREVAQQMALEVNGRNGDFESFERWLEDRVLRLWSSAGQGPFPLLFLIDDCDRMVSADEDGNGKLDFACDQLRHLRQNERIGEQVTVVLAGYRAFHGADHRGGSPLKNICTPKYLQLLDRSSFSRLLTELGVVDLPEDIRSAIEGHPYLAHFVAAQLRGNGTPPDMATMSKRLQTDATEGFKALRAALSEEERSVLGSIARAAPNEITGDGVDPEVRDVLLYSGLIRLEERSGVSCLVAPVGLLNRFMSAAVSPRRNACASAPSKSEGTVSWLHVSDFHFGDNMDPDRNRVVEALIEDVAMLSESWAPDFIAVTGDITFSAKVSQFEKAWSYLVRLADAAHLGTDRVFVVAGNHDVDRDSHRSTVFQGLRAAADNPAYARAYDELLDGGLQQQAILARLRTFTDWSAAHFPTRKGAPGQLWFAEHIEVRGLRVAIVGLNSAWTSGEDGEDTNRHLVVGLRQAEAAIEALKSGPESTDIRLFLMHHPLECIHRLDAALLERLLLHNCDVLLRGHLHDSRVLVQSEPGGGHYAMLAAGSGYEHRWRHNGYSLLRAQVRSSRIRVEGLMRRWLADQFRFASDTDSYAGATTERSFQLHTKRRQTPRPVPRQKGP